MSVYSAATTGGHRSITDYDDYTGNVIHTDTQAEMDAYKKKRKAQYEQQQLNQKLRMYDDQAFKYKDQLMNLFASRADRDAAQMVGAASRGFQRAAIRGGLEGGGLSQALLSRERSKILGTAIGGKMDFNQKLLQYMQESRDRVVTGELDFFNELEKMKINERLQERFARFQARLAQDQASRDAFTGMLGMIGGAAMMFIPGMQPVGAGLMAGSMASMGSNPYASTATPTFTTPRLGPYQYPNG